MKFKSIWKRLPGILFFVFFMIGGIFLFGGTQTRVRSGAVIAAAADTVTQKEANVLPLAEEKSIPLPADEIVELGVSSLLINSSYYRRNAVFRYAYNGAQHDIAFENNQAVLGYCGASLPITASVDYGGYIYDVYKNGLAAQIAYPIGKAFYLDGNVYKPFRGQVSVSTAADLKVAVFWCDYYLSNNAIYCKYSRVEGADYVVRLSDNIALSAQKIASQDAVSATYLWGSAMYLHNGVAQGAYTSGQVLRAEGQYDITTVGTTIDGAVVTDTKTLYVDHTPPVLPVTEQSDKTSVKTSWTVGQYESPVTATYTHNGVYVGAYASGYNLTQEGKYVITVTDAAGNVSTATLIVDKTPPELLRTAEYAKDAASASWRVGAYESAVTAVYTITTQAGTSQPKAYTSGTSLTAEGKYTVTATDAAGNVAAITFVIDRTSPGIKTSAQVTKDETSASWTVGQYESPVTATYTKDGMEQGGYLSGQVLAAEGKYIITALDAAGNSAEMTLIVDKTAPALSFTAEGQTFTDYTRDAFIAAGEDNLSGVKELLLHVGGAWIPYDYLPRSENGAYLFRLTDYAGNLTTATITVYRTDTFGNLAAIRNGYKLNAWYVVTLPARIFTTPGKDRAGRYSFATYDEALRFAVALEREFRVTAVQGGWMYVSATNEAVSQKYTDEKTLSAAVNQYAAGYVSTRQTASEKGGDRYYYEPQSLTRNAPTLPDYLLDLKDLPRYFVQASAVWALPKLSYLSGMPYSVAAEYLGDDLSEQEFSVDIPAGTGLQSALGGRYKQGWYQITESDAAGNVETYLVYVDAELPSARVTVVSGAGEHVLTLDDTYIKNETLYFLSLRFEFLSDRSDPFVTLKIVRGSSSYYYTQSDSLPILGSDDFGAGKYTVTIFDRSLNALTFEVFIAGDAPKWTHSSLAADRADCTITFVPGDRYNVLTELSIFKVEYDGTRTQIGNLNGVSVSAATLSYRLTVGGKYCAVIHDNYGRTLELPAIFFLKGLPEGKLSGVVGGGRTNKNVSFTFNANDVAVIYTLEAGGRRSVFTDYSVQTGTTETTYNITADETTSHEFLVFLHNAGDMSLFVEYGFEIDCVLPEFKITNSDGELIAPDGATNRSFRLSWEETGVTVRYYTARSGSIGAMKYTLNTVLSLGTLYYFTLKDDVGNVTEFTVLLDNTVDYTLSGNYNAVDGVLYSNRPLTFTVSEPTQRFEVVNADGYTILNGGALTQAGRYEITVTDNYDNTLRLVIVIDYMPPEIALDGVQSGKTTKNPVTVYATGYDYLYRTDAKGNVLKAITSGEVFELGGKYYITASDFAGNVAATSFQIDLGVDYTLSLPNGAITTDKVTLAQQEPLTVEATRDGETFAVSGDAFSQPGVYELTLTDELGNIAAVSFTILRQRMRELAIELPEAASIVSVLKDGETFGVSGDRLSLTESGIYVITLGYGGTPYAFTLQIDNVPPTVDLKENADSVKIAGVDKENYTIRLTKDGKVIDCRVGLTLKDPGKYTLTVTDDLGNVSTVEFTIKYKMNTWAVIAIVVGVLVALTALVLIIRARRRPRVV